jgi:hypothetical protein
MKNNERLMKSGDPVEQLGSWAREIDQYLSEIAHLTVELYKASTAGNADALKAIHEKIAALKTQLNQL